MRSRPSGSSRPWSTWQTIALVIAVVRGDHELNEAKLQTATGAERAPTGASRGDPDRSWGRTPARSARSAFGKAPVFVDQALAERTNMVTGANEDGFHLRGVDVRRDLLGHGKLAELRTVQAR